MRIKPCPLPQCGSCCLGRKALAIFLISPGIFIAKGQEALFNAISVQNNIGNASSAFVPAPDQPHLGPVRYNVGVYTGLTFTDNVNNSQTNTESDVISQTGINLGLQWPATENSNLQLNTGIGYLHYFKYASNNGLVVTPDSILNYALTWDEASLNFYDQLTYTRQVYTEPALANVATLPQLGNTAGVLGQWDQGHWTFQASYSFVINRSDGSHNYLNSDLQELFGRAGWRFARATQAGVEASGGLTSYQAASQSNNSYYSLGAYVEWQVKPWLQLTARGGPSFYEFYPQTPGAVSSSLPSYYVSFAINHEITDFLSENLSLIRSIQLAANQGSDYVQQLSFDYSLNWEMTQHVNLGASLGYDNGQQPFTEGFIQIFPGVLVPIQVTEHYQLYSGGLSAGWQFTGHLTTSLAYSHTQRDSDFSGRSYATDSVTVQINYNF
jgi:hypothetical protein